MRSNFQLVGLRNYFLFIIIYKCYLIRERFLYRNFNIEKSMDFFKHSIGVVAIIKNVFYICNRASSSIIRCLGIGDYFINPIL